MPLISEIKLELKNKIRSYTSAVYISAALNMPSTCSFPGRIGNNEWGCEEERRLTSPPVAVGNLRNGFVLNVSGISVM